MEYDEFVDTLEEMAVNANCKIPYLPEPEMVKAVLGYVDMEDKICLAYSVGKIIEILMERDNMELDDAREYFSFNIERSVFYGNLNVLFVY